MLDVTPALKLLYGQQTGILSTHSVKAAGYPYGSLLPFCLDATGQPLALISGLAQHTVNLRADGRASLTLTARPLGEMNQAQPRLTLLAEAEFLDESEIQILAGRYARYQPLGPDPQLLSDFRFIRLKLRQAHFIGGFGEIHWFDAERLIRPWPFTFAQEASFCEDLNTREPELLHNLWKALTGLAPAASVALAGIDARGGDLRVAGQLRRFDFDETPADLEAVWHALHQAHIV